MPDLFKDLLSVFCKPVLVGNSASIELLNRQTVNMPASLGPFIGITVLRDDNITEMGLLLVKGDGSLQWFPLGEPQPPVPKQRSILGQNNAD